MPQLAKRSFAGQDRHEFIDSTEEPANEAHPSLSDPRLDADIVRARANASSSLGQRWISSAIRVMTTIVDAVDVRRYQGPLAAMALVCLGMALGSVAIAATDPHWPNWLYPTDPTARLEHIERSGNKLAALVRGKQRLGDDRLGILLGSSSMMLGIDGKMLEAESKVPIRWLELCSGGINGDDLARVFRLILWSRLKPDCIILGLQPDLLPQTTNCLGPDGDEIYVSLSNLRRDALAGRLGDSLADVEKACSAYLDPFFPSRTLVNYRLREAIFEAKCNAFRTAGMAINSMFIAERDPWAVPEAKERHGPVTVRQGYFKNGRYDTQCYDVDNVNFRALAWMIDEADRRGIRILVVIMPATRFDLGMQPPRAEQCMWALLNRESAPDLPVLNLRTEFPDDDFADLFHLAKDARAVATKRVAEFVRSQYRKSPQ